MSEVFTLVASVASLAVSLASLLFTVAAYRRLDDQASETFAVIGADEGNHEARLERLETNAHLKVIPSPSALEAFTKVEGIEPDTFLDEFAFGEEDAALRAEDEAMHAAATNEGMAHGN
jgi:hypothetical protein